RHLAYRGCIHGIAVRDVADARFPRAQLIDQGALAGNVAVVAAGKILSELPDANSPRHSVEVVLRDHVSVAEIGVSGGAVLVEEERLRAGLEIDDAVVFAVPAVDVLLDHKVASALVDLALVVIALCGYEGRQVRTTIVKSDASKFLVRAAVLH